jgi:ABC-type phosphate transport system substrate-binding protein
MYKPAIAVLLLSLAIASVSSGAAETGRFTLVVNASRPSALTREQVADIFLKRAIRWSDGTPITPFDLSVGDPTRQEFSKTMLGRSPESIVYHWQQELSTRYVKPPLVKSATEILAIVSSTAGGIGYVGEGTELPEGVKAATVVESTR